MARKYQKYVKETGSTLGYQRAIPTRLLHISPTKLFTYPLGLPRTAVRRQTLWNHLTLFLSDTFLPVTSPV